MPTKQQRKTKRRKDRQRKEKRNREGARPQFRMPYNARPVGLTIEPRVDLASAFEAYAAGVILRRMFRGRM